MRTSFFGPCLALAAFAVLPSCRWDFDQLPVKDFRQNLCDVLDNFQKNAQDNCAKQTDPASRDACFAKINADLAALAATKLAAVNAYSNCNDQQLKAAQALAEKLIETIIKTAGDLVNPLKGIDLKALGHKLGIGSQATMQLAASSQVVLLAGTKPSGPLQLGGTYSLDLRPSGSGFAGPITDVSWRASLPAVGTWRVTLIPGPQNTYTLAPAPTGFAGEVRMVVLIDGPGVYWATATRLPLAVSQDLSTWAISTGNGIVPAHPFFPMAPAAGIRLGKGCPGSNGRMPENSPASVTRIGDPLVMRLDDALPNTPVYFMLGLSSSVFAGLPLPLDLGLLGAPGCPLRVSWDLVLPTATDGAGSAMMAVPIPSLPALVGASLYTQWLCVDQGANRLGAVTSDGVRATFYGR